MDQGKDILLSWPQEVQKQYGYLRSRLQAVPGSDDSAYQGTLKEVKEIDYPQTRGHREP